MASSPSDRLRAALRGVGRNLGQLAVAAAIVVGLAVAIPWLIERVWR